MTATLPILYSFRRCPYAMRARMAMISSGQNAELREVKLANKPAAMIAASAKATVPVLVLDDGQVLEESLSIMHWALTRNDPESWLNGRYAAAATDLIRQSDGPFKYHLDRYKYHTRYDGADPTEHRAAGLAFLEQLEAQLTNQNLPTDTAQLFGTKRSYADIAIFPFVRQFANNDRDWFDALELPYLQNWLSRHLTSQLFATAMQKERPWQEGDATVTFPGSTG